MAARGQAEHAVLRAGQRVARRPSRDDHVLERDGGRRHHGRDEQQRPGRFRAASRSAIRLSTTTSRTTATFTGDVTVCIKYAGSTFSGAPRLLHYDGSGWVDATTSDDSVAQIVCGVVQSLSPFVLASRSAAHRHDAARNRLRIG